MWWCTPLMLAVPEAELGESLECEGQPSLQSMFQDSQSTERDPITKTKTKSRAGESWHLFWRKTQV